MASSLDLTRLLGVPDALATPAVALLAVSAVLGVAILTALLLPRAGRLPGYPARHAGGPGMAAPATGRGDLPG